MSTLSYYNRDLVQLTKELTEQPLAVILPCTTEDFRQKVKKLDPVMEHPWHRDITFMAYDPQLGQKPEGAQDRDPDQLRGPAHRPTVAAE